MHARLEHLGAAFLRAKAIARGESVLFDGVNHLFAPGRLAELSTTLRSYRESRSRQYGENQNRQNRCSSSTSRQRHGIVPRAMNVGGSLGNVVSGAEQRDGRFGASLEGP
jgi:hypothetical protein